MCACMYRRVLSVSRCITRRVVGSHSQILRGVLHALRICYIYKAREYWNEKVFLDPSRVLWLPRICSILGVVVVVVVVVVVYMCAYMRVCLCFWVYVCVYISCILCFSWCITRRVVRPDVFHHDLFVWGS